MLAEMIESGYGDEQNYTCAERILCGANEAYNLQLQPDALKLAAGMGGGLGIGALCGAVNAGVMVLGRLYEENGGRNSKRMKVLVKEYLDRFQAEAGSIECSVLRAQRKDSKLKCHDLIVLSARLLDEIRAQNAP